MVKPEEYIELVFINIFKLYPGFIVSLDYSRVDWELSLTK